MRTIKTHIVEHTIGVYKVKFTTYILKNANIKAGRLAENDFDVEYNDRLFAPNMSVEILYKDKPFALLGLIEKSVTSAIKKQTEILRCLANAECQELAGYNNAGQLKILLTY